MKNKVGRPTTPLCFPFVLWAFVELMRDREDGGERRSVRAACRLVQQQFSEELKGGRFLTVDTIRRQHADMEKIMRDDAFQRAAATAFLEYGRQRREAFGWGTSLWLFLIDPALNMARYDMDAKIDPADGEVVLMMRRK